MREWRRDDVEALRLWHRSAAVQLNADIEKMSWSWWYARVA
jgi:hypothetical protein